MTKTLSPLWKTNNTTHIKILLLFFLGRPPPLPPNKNICWISTWICKLFWSTWSCMFKRWCFSWKPSLILNAGYKSRYAYTDASALELQWCALRSYLIPEMPLAFKTPNQILSSSKGWRSMDLTLQLITIPSSNCSIFRSGIYIMFFPNLNTN